MKVALVTLNDSADVHQWSGLNYFIARALERAGAEVVRVGPLQTRWTTAMRLRQRWHGLTGDQYHAVIEPAALNSLGESARARIPADADAVLSITSLVAAAVGPISIPHLSWDDATNAAMDQYYPDFHRLAAITRRHSAALGQRAADAVDVAIYASQWAADSACAAYGMESSRVAVVPFGANLEELPSDADIERFIQRRSRDVMKLLWVGVDWERKGGPATMELLHALRSSGIPAELTVVGCDPEGLGDVRVEGFISKREAQGRARLARLFAESHFFVMPSTAEAYGLVYAEASTYGIPSVALATGGVPTIVVDDETGLLADPPALPEKWLPRIVALWRDQQRYEAMARAARRRAVERLNWDVAGHEVLRLINRVAGREVAG